MTVGEFIKQIEEQGINLDTDLVFDYEGYLIDIGSLTVTNRRILDDTVPTVILQQEMM